MDAAGTADTETLTISKVEISNFGRIVSATLSLGDTCLQMIVGPNGAGKTTILSSLAACISGKKALPLMPLKQGQTEGSVRLTLAHGLEDRYEIIARRDGPSSWSAWV